MDRRNFPRIEASTPLEFNVRHLEAKEEPWIGGVIANLSLTGIFFFRITNRRSNKETSGISPSLYLTLSRDFSAHQSLRQGVR